jgi:hypothetical protein
MKDKFLKSLPITTGHQRLAVDNCIAIFLVGSHLYGSNDVNSDLDYEGIFIEPPEYVVGCKSCDEVDFSTKSNSKKSAKNTPKDIDCKLYSLKNFFSLAQKNNPNKVEFFYMPERNIVYLNEKYWKQIEEARDLFISLKVYSSFLGYANSQKKKLLTKKKRLAELREFVAALDKAKITPKKIIGDIFDFRQGSYWPYKFIDRTVTLEGSPAIRVQEKEFNSGMNASIIYEHAKAIIGSYGKRVKDLDDSGYDLKFASHLFRLYYEGLQLLREGTLTFPLVENAHLLAVKRGDYSLEEILQRASEIEPLFDLAYQQSKLRHSPDQDGISKLQTEMYLEYWREKGFI